MKTNTSFARHWQIFDFSQTDRTPLHAAAEKGHVEVVQFLLQREADMDARDKDGNIPLHLSTENKQTRVTQVLLENGNFPDTTNEVKSRFLHFYIALSQMSCTNVCR